MHQIARLFGSVLFKGIRRLNKVVYLRAILFEPKNICTSPSNLAYFSGRILLTSQTTSRKLCDIPTLTCWKCSYSYQASVNGQTTFFCPSCGVVQEPNSDRTYFDIMNWCVYMLCVTAFVIDKFLRIILLKCLQCLRGFSGSAIALVVVLIGVQGFYILTIA